MRSPMDNNKPNIVFNFPMEAMAGINSIGVSPFFHFTTVLNATGAESNGNSRKMEPMDSKNVIHIKKR